MDVRSFFASIEHARLRCLLNAQVEDARIQSLVGHIVANGPPGALPGHGLPVGNLTSQYFANAYLAVLDRITKHDLQVRGYVRYMDDMVLLAHDKADLWAWHAAIEASLRSKLGLVLRPDATRLGPVRDGVAFLGVRIWPNLIRMSPGNLRRWRAKMRHACRAVDAGRMATVDAIRVVAGLEGWAQHANTRQLRRVFFNRRAM
ncbi:MAG: RNA-directed DNA polymerase [Bradymonadia bacterium]